MRIFRCIVLLLLLASAGSGCWFLRNRPARLADLPRFQEALDAEGIRAETRGRTVLVEFWSRLCSHSEELIPEMQRLQEQYGADGLLVISVCQDGADTEPLVRDFLLARGANYTVIFDDGRISDEFRVPAAPALYLFDTKGRLAGRNLDTKDLEGLERLIKRTLPEGAAGQAVAAPD